MNNYSSAIQKAKPATATLPFLHSVQVDPLGVIEQHLHRGDRPYDSRKLMVHMWSPHGSRDSLLRLRYHIPSWSHSSLRDAWTPHRMWTHGTRFSALRWCPPHRHREASWTQWTSWHREHNSAFERLYITCKTHVSWGRLARSIVVSPSETGDRGRR